MRITVLLSVSALGDKLPPTLILKKCGTNGTRFRHINGAHYFYNEKAWVNQLLIKSWLSRCLNFLMKENVLCGILATEMKTSGLYTSMIFMVNNLETYGIIGNFSKRVPKAKNQAKVLKR